MSVKHKKIIGSVFITFSGNCKRALRFYQRCFGGELRVESFDKKVIGYTESPVVSGSLISDTIIIHGSDMVHNEGRKLGNYIAIYLQCRNTNERNALVKKMAIADKNLLQSDNPDQKLIEFTDAFDVRWILGI